MLILISRPSQMIPAQPTNIIRISVVVFLSDSVLLPLLYYSRRPTDPGIEVIEWPLGVATDSGPGFLYHPLLRGGFLDDVYECFEDAHLANAVMTRVSEDVASFTPLVAQRCVLSGWNKS